MEFRWNEWNVQHVWAHGILPVEAELVARGAAAPYPIFRGDGKYLVWGCGSGGRPLQMVYVLDADGTVYVIHARPLTEREKGQWNRHRRGRGQR